MRLGQKWNNDPNPTESLTQLHFYSNYTMLRSVGKQACYLYEQQQLPPPKILLSPSSLLLPSSSCVSLFSLTARGSRLDVGGERIKRDRVTHWLEAKYQPKSWFNFFGGVRLLTWVREASSFGRRKTNRHTTSLHGAHVRRTHRASGKLPKRLASVVCERS